MPESPPFLLHDVYRRAGHNGLHRRQRTVGVQAEYLPCDSPLTARTRGSACHEVANGTTGVV